MSKKSAEEVLLDNVVEVNEDSIIPSDHEKRPSLGDENWSEYVLSNLSESEYGEHNGKKFPKVDGLLRLVQKLIGNIITSKSKQVYRTEELSCIEHTIQVMGHSTLFEDNTLLESTGIGDAYYGNTDKPFNKFLDACAATRAKGRALRELLQLKVCTYEELSKTAEQTEDDNNDRIAASQKAGIKNLCNRLNIDIKKFIASGEFKYEKIDHISAEKAKGMIKALQMWEKDISKIPQNILVEDEE